MPSKATTTLWSWSWSWPPNNEPLETFQVIFITLLPLSFFLGFIFIIIKQKNKNPPSPPGPFGLPWVGYLPFLGPNLHHNFKELATLYGPIFKIRLGSKDCIVVSSPSLVKEVVRDHDVVFANRVPLIAAQSLLFGTLDIAFSDYGVEWRKMRKIFVGELMSNTSLDASYHLRKQQINKMLNETYKIQGKLVDIGELAFKTLISAMMNMMWGDTLERDESSIINAEFRAIVDKQLQLLGAPNISDFFPILARLDIQGIEREMKEISNRCEQILDLAINRHKSGENMQQKDFLGKLLQVTKYEEPSRSLTLSQVKAILMDAVTGGTDTTVAFVEWAMAEILNNPKVLEKIQQELTGIVGLNTIVEESHLHKLHYLNAVVKETLRLHPPIPLLVPHSPSEPSTIGGYSIPKGARVFLNVYTIQRDPLLWEDPLQFKPERFLNRSEFGIMDYLGNHFDFFPFGSGRRMCPGIPLAERMSVMLLASLLHAFEWKLPCGNVEINLSEKFGIVVKLEKPLFAMPSPRLSNMELYSYND